MQVNSKQAVIPVVLALGMYLLFLSGMGSIVPRVSAAEPEAAALPVYKPPLRGAPATRVGGGTRGEGDQATQLYVLTPEHTGLTLQTQPVLYWYLSRAIPARYEFVLMAETDYEPVVEAELTTVDTAGIQRIALADYNAHLSPGQLYQWSVALVMDDTLRSGDILSSGMIEHIAPPAGIMDRVANATGEARIGHYADASLWYDALQDLDELIQSGTNDARLRQVRASLLEQVGLEEVAAVLDGLNESGSGKP